ncbi:acyltransferase [Aurantiacibacter sp. MUD11]|uniref:acyltransferase family protein n=1 Tax=Aurantiacibacter sp. MUD11 TaxID=3003265 RepID=UPI0022AB0A12|nr:acyltransferase [Aurantiacibacter sp. MUD11]WAT17598.1 acyltransferase [Aurantiacibacter sp. MUD11]
MAEHHDGKIVAIQLLRFCAAFAVALSHQAMGFADHIGGGLGVDFDRRGIGQIAVALFFLISGYIMVVSSRHLFGEVDARRVFWTRRAVRILPPYWLATLLLVGILLVLVEESVDPAELVQSLLLWPYWPADESLRAVPVLWVGWTLFYEMLFYALFGLFVAMPRRRALLGTAAVLLLLVAVGTFVPAENAFLYTATRPVLLLFVAGLALGWWRGAGGELPKFARVLAVAATLAALYLIGEPADPTAMGFDYLAWCGLPALLLALAALGGPLSLPAPRLVERGGDISYALYLLHLPAAHFWMWTSAQLRLPGGSWGYLLAVMAGTLIASWLFFQVVERPATRWLNRRLGAARRGDRLLQQTGV